MIMTEKIVWRLKEMPTPENLRELVKDGILSKDEAREILFNLEEIGITSPKMEDLKSEIKFLRELVEKLIVKQEIQGKVVEIIRESEKPYHPYPWWNPYWTWTTTSNSSIGTSTNFSDIETF